MSPPNTPNTPNEPQDPSTIHALDQYAAALANVGYAMATLWATLVREGVPRDATTAIVAAALVEVLRTAHRPVDP